MRLFNFLEGFGIGFNLLFEVMYKLFELLNGPVIDIDVLALIFNSAHVVHETLGINSSLENLISKEDLFTFFCC